MLSFDAHNVIKELVAEGLKETVAEKIVRTITASKSSDMDKLPSKEQLFAVEKQLDSVAKQVATVERDVSIVKQDLSDMEKHATTMEKDVENFKDNFVTKVDLLATEKRLDDKIHQVKAEIAFAQNTMLKWYIPTSITIVVVITGVLFKLLGH